MAGIGSTPALLVATAVGGAAAAAFEPALEVPRQQAWKDAPNRILNADLLARLVAQGGIDLASAQAEALLDGYGPDKVSDLVYLAQTVPGVPEALTLWRRGLLNDDLFTHVLVKAGLDQRYAAPLQNLKTAELIGLGDVATAIVRGAVPAPAWVPVAPPTTTDNVPRFPVTNLDPVQLAAKLGFDEDMLRIMTARSGLSLAPVLATQAFFRGKLTANDWLLAIAEGDLRTEWAETLKEAARAIPSPHDFSQGWLRGWIPLADAYAGAARHGMVQADLDLLRHIERRPLNVHAITTGLARGGTFDAAQSDFTDPYEAAVHQADLGPEWYDLAIANRYVYPSAFVLRTLAQAGDLGDQVAVEQVLLEIGWKPSFATQVSTAWVGGTGGADKHVVKAQTSLWATTHRSYVAEEIDDAAATAALTTAGVAAGSIPAVLAIWQQERALVRKQLTPAQIRKAVSGGVVNPATGVAWTQADAIAALLARGYDQADAETFLAE